MGGSSHMDFLSCPLCSDRMLCEDVRCRLHLLRILGTSRDHDILGHSMLQLEDTHHLIDNQLQRFKQGKLKIILSLLKISYVLCRL